MTPKIVLTTCLISLLFVCGCKTPFFSRSSNWPEPEKPEHAKVIFYSPNEVPLEEGSLILTPENAANLADNLDNMRAYIEKLELLIKEMKDYYNAK